MIQDDDLKKLEQTLGRPFPAEYRRFLAALDSGGGPARARFRFPGSTKGSRLDFFFPVTGGDRFLRLGHYLRTYQQRIPPPLIPVARDVFGNMICLGLSGEHEGRIYFRDHEREAEPEEQPYWGNVELLAPNLGEFLAALAEEA